MQTESMIDSVRRLVTVESPTDDVDSCARAVDAAVAVCAEWLSAPATAGSHAGRPILRWGPGHPRVLMLGHLDTVWPIGTLERLPWTVREDRMTGPGVFDMKAGAVQAICAIAHAGLTPDSGVGLLLTTDEETGSATSRDLIADAVREAQAVLVFEPSLGGRLKTRRKGTSWYTIEFTGRAAHAGLDPERGVNALLAAAQFALDSTDWADASAGTTVTATTMQAGTTTNTVPAEARLTLDVRAWSRAEQERVDSLVRQTPSALGTRTISGGIDRAALEAHHSAELFALAERVAEEQGMPSPGSAAVGGASDGNLTAAHGVPTLDGLGAVGDGAHADDEWASVAALAPRARLAAGIVTALLERDPR